MLLQVQPGDEDKQYNGAIGKFLAFCLAKGCQPDISAVTDMEICNYMELHLEKKSYKNFVSGINGLLFMAHAKEPGFGWATDMRRAAQSTAVVADIPAEDMGPALKMIRELYRAAALDETALGKSPHKRFLRVRQIVVFLTRLDTGTRSADLAGLPLLNFRTRPARVPLDKAAVIWFRFRRPKEQRLRMAGTYWSKEIGIVQNPGCKDADYWTSSFAWWWAIYVRLRKEIGGDFRATDECGYAVEASHAFTDFRGNAIGTEKLSNSVKKLLVDTGVMGKHTRFTSKHLRHHFTTFCIRLPVEEGHMKKEEVVATLRHSGLGSLRHYLATDVHPDVRQRHEATASSKRRQDERAQWLRH